MLGDIASLTDGYLSWVTYNDKYNPTIIIAQEYMNKTHGKCLTLCTRLFRLDNFKRGFRHGTCRSWYDSGQKQDIYHFKYGEFAGTHKSWHENGRLKYKTFYINGSKYGKETIWYPDGRIQFENYWVNEYRQILIQN